MTITDAKAAELRALCDAANLFWDEPQTIGKNEVMRALLHAALTAIPDLLNEREELIKERDRIARDLKMYRGDVCGTWRCFQCDKVFTNRSDAQRHFGWWPADKPMCVNEHAGSELYWRDRFVELDKIHDDTNRKNFERWTAEKTRADTAEAERDAAIARAEKAEAERDSFNQLYQSAHQRFLSEQAKRECAEDSHASQRRNTIAFMNERDAAIARAEELEKENFALAADQCHDGYGDERGNHRCKEVDAAIARAEQAEADCSVFIASNGELTSEVLTLRTALAASLSREKKLREALEPFASVSDFRALSDLCRQSDLTRARAALNASKKDQPHD